MAAEKTPARRWLPRIAMAALLAAAAAAVASPAAAAPHSSAAINASHPPGYEIIASGPEGAPPSTFTSGTFATCPAGTVVWGGGVTFLGSPDFNLTVNTSNPNGSGGWAARVNNTGTTSEQFEVDAICANKPKGYQIVSSTVDNPAGTQSHSTATCPSPNVLLGGGTLSTADQVGAIVTSAWPRTSAKFTGYMDNATTSDANFIVYAICGHKPSGYTIVSSGAALGPDSALVDGIACPTGTSALDGGAQAPAHVPAVQVSASIDGGPSGWGIEVNNTGQSVDQVNGYAICAA